MIGTSEPKRTMIIARLSRLRNYWSRPSEPNVGALAKSAPAFLNSDELPILTRPL